MKPGGWVHTSIMEIGIQFLMKTIPSSSKKVIMPLRIGVSTYFALFFLFLVLIISNHMNLVLTPSSYNADSYAGNGVGWR